MTQQITLKSLEDLGQFADVIVADEPVSDERALVPRPPEPAAALDLDALVETIRRSALELQVLSTADASARKQAEEALAMHRRLTTDAGHIQRIVGEAEIVARQASAFAVGAFSLECQEGAAQVAEVAAMVANEARGRLQSITIEADALAVREDVSRLLIEERAREKAAQRAAEEREREARLAEAIAEADALARARNFDEALRRLGCLVTEHPNSPGVASCIDKVRRQEWAVKTSLAEQALRAARRNRRDPRTANSVLEVLDLTCVPDVLARQIYGCWLHACHRLYADRAVHYAAAFCKGAVLVPTEDGQLEVVSAIGLPRWHAGRRFSRVALKGARPLK